MDYPWTLVNTEDLRSIQSKQAEALAICEKNGIVFDDLGKEPGNWQHLAFTFYTMLCEIEAIASVALHKHTGEEDECAGVVSFTTRNDDHLGE